MLPFTAGGDGGGGMPPPLDSSDWLRSQLEASSSSSSSSSSRWSAAPFVGGSNPAPAPSFILESGMAGEALWRSRRQEDEPDAPPDPAAVAAAARDAAESRRHHDEFVAEERVRQAAMEALLSAEGARLQARKRLLLHEVAAEGGLRPADYDEWDPALVSADELRFAEAAEADTADVRAAYTTAARLEAAALAQLAELMERAGCCHQLALARERCGDSRSAMSPGVLHSNDDALGGTHGISWVFSGCSSWRRWSWPTGLSR